MNKTRLEAFSDAVIAIILTIMVLEIKVPEGHEWKDLAPLVPKLIGYILSFVYIMIYWNNHHHLFQLVKAVDGKILWANNILLFCLSLLSFSSGWLSESNFAMVPTIIYGLLLLLCSLSFWFLSYSIKSHKGNQKVREVAGSALVLKEWYSTGFYIIGVIITFYSPLIALLIYFAIAIYWVVPSKRIERIFKD